MPHLVSSVLSLYLAAAPALQPLCQASLSQPTTSYRPAPGSTFSRSDFVDRTQLHAIAVGCPASPGNGILEINRRNLAGQLHRVQLFYVDDRPTYLIIESADRASDSFRVAAEINYATSTSPDDMTLVRKVYTVNQPLKMEYCEGNGAARQKWIDILRTNRALLGDSE